MAIVGSFTGDLTVYGGLYGLTTLAIPAGTIVDADVSSTAAIDASKLDHLHSVLGSQSGTATTEHRVIHVGGSSSGGTIHEFVAGSMAIAIGDSTVYLDLKKNGATILAGTGVGIVLDSANVAYVGESATLSDQTISDGDVISVDITATVNTGTLPTGLFWQAKISEPYPDF